MPLDKDALDALRMDRAAVAAGARRRALPWVILSTVVILAAAGGAAFWLLYKGPVPVKTTVVRQAAAETAPTGAVLSASGYVVARRISTPSAKITAQVKEVFVEEGMAVEEGQILAQLDDAMPRKQLALAESELEAARRAVAEYEVRLVEAEKTLNRNRSLIEQRLVSEAVLDASEAEVNALRARIAAARSQVEVAERNVAVARQSVEDTVIRAPFSGVVVSKDAQPGEMISPISAGGGFTRTGICTLVDMDSLEIEVDVNEAFINRVRDGQPVEAVLDAYPDWRIPAHVISIVPTADRQKATVRVRVGIDVRDARILPDMGVQVRFLEGARPAPAPDGQPAPRLLVSERAVVGSQGTNYVFVVRNGTVERRAVRVGPPSEGEMPVLAGLQAGDVVVQDPPPELTDGAPVQVVRN
jgi:RND family efflux transporter MFP subunit